MGLSAVLIVISIVASAVTLVVVLALVVKLPPIPPMVVFLLVMGSLIGLLLVVNHVANLYLSGYFNSHTEETNSEFGEDDGIDESALLTGSEQSLNVIKTASASEKLRGVFSSEEDAVKEIQRVGFPNVIASQAILTGQLELKPGGYLLGTLRELSNVITSDASDCKELCIHVKLYPRKKAKIVMNWLPVRTTVILRWSFTMKNVTEDVRNSNLLCIRLYGRGSPLKTKTCYGQVFMPLSGVGEQATSFKKRIMPYTKTSMTL